MLESASLARQFNLSACCLDFGLSRSGDLVDLDSQGLGDFAIAENLNGLGSLLDDALGNKGLAVDGLAGLELELKTGNVDGGVLDAVDVAEAGELRQATSQRSLATLEAYALAATSAGLLTVKTTTGGLTGAGAATATNALAVFLEPSAGRRSLSSMFGLLLFA